MDGTTGYDFANAVGGLFVESANRRAFDDIYRRFTGLRQSFRDIAYECKQLIMDTTMASELNVLGYQLSRLAQRNRRTRDFTLNSLTDALREVTACFPVYRTYVSEQDETVSERDRAHIDTAIARARRRNPAVPSPVFDFVRDTLLLVPFADDSEDDRAVRRDFVMKFQQYTGPVMAKGVEDTAFYRYNRLVSLNEVGGEPEQFGTSPAAFHRQNLERARRRPAAMITTATHDTKRGEDTRARISVLSELPREWRSALSRWGRLNRRKKLMVDGVPAPDPNEEYLLYQTLIGAWPLPHSPTSGPQPQPSVSEGFVARMQQYMLKAVKEAKVNTSWVNPNGPYDAAVQEFVARILVGGDDNPFLRDFIPFQQRVARAGMVNGLAQVVLKVAAPGVPDVYQGTELWDLSLVDPDNRRPVDYNSRAAALAAIARILEGERAGAAQDLLSSWQDGRVKLYVLHRALTLRRERPELFQHGGYVPLTAQGPRHDNVCAFARTHDAQMAVAVVPRLVARLVREPDGLPLGQQVWGESFLPLPGGTPGTRFVDRFTGAVVTAIDHGGGAALPLASVFDSFPVALLIPIEGTPA